MKDKTKKSKEKIERTPKQKRDRRMLSLFAIGLAIAAAILVYPSFADSLYDTQQVAMIGGYEASISAYNAEEISAMKEAAIKYNAKIYADQKIDPFYYQGEEYEDEEYDSLLTPLENSLVMGYIEIPSLDIYLPITHGTRTDDLEFMVGHMRGTSLPIGGASTHAILAAHTGLQNVDLFTNVVDMKEGDEFYIHVLDEIHVYTVDQITVTLPEDVSPYLQIVDGEDYVTLFTCTPYGINDHRLMVRGTRTGDLAYDGTVGDTANVKNHNIKAILLTIMWGLIPLLVLLLGLIYADRKTRNKDPYYLEWLEKYINRGFRTKKEVEAGIPPREIIPEVMGDLVKEKEKIEISDNSGEKNT